jgi:hypothetical protein
LESAMLDVHIDDFFKDCATILLIGFKHFPRPHTLFVEDISGPDQMDDFGLHSNRHLSAMGTLSWLKEEGYIRFSGQDRQESIDDFVLTSKALMRLLSPSQSTDNTTAETPTPVIQVLEFARLQNDTTWISQIIQTNLITP